MVTLEYISVTSIKLNITDFWMFKPYLFAQAIFTLIVDTLLQSGAYFINLVYLILEKGIA